MEFLDVHLPGYSLTTFGLPKDTVAIVGSVALTFRKRRGRHRDDSTNHFAKPMRLKADGEVHLVNPNDILWVESQGNYVVVNSRDSKFLCRMTLAQLKGLLPVDRFAQTHRKYIVGLKHVASFRPTGKGDQVVSLSDGTEVRVSRTFRDEFLSRLESR